MALEEVFRLYAEVKSFLYHNSPIQIARWFYLNIIKFSKPFVQVDMLNGKFRMFIDSRDKGFSRLYYRDRIHEAVPTYLFIKSLSTIKYPCSILDIGSHLGYYALIEALFSPCNVHAVEPEPHTFELLKMNVKLNDLENRVFTYNAAMCENEGYIEFISSKKSEHSRVKGLLQRDRLKDIAEIVKVKCVNIDNFCERLDIDRLSYIRMDVEGYELNVLKGGRKTLDNVERLFIEVHSELMPRYRYSIKDFYDFLTRYDYKVRYIVAPFTVKNPPLAAAIRRFLRARPSNTYLGSSYFNIYEVNTYLRDLVEKADTILDKLTHYWLFLENSQYDYVISSSS